MKVLVETEDYEFVELEDEGYVAAGKTIPFQPPPETTLVPLPPKLAALARKGLVKPMRVYGDSLIGIGIYDGDRLIVKKAYSKKEIGNDTVCVVYVPAWGDVVAKKIRFLAGKIVLKACNRNEDDIKVNENDIEIRGVVVSIMRKPDEYGRFDRNYDPEFPF